MGITIVLILTNTQLSSYWENKVIYIHEKDASEFLEKNEDTYVVDEDIVVYKSDSQGYVVVFPDGANINSSPMTENRFMPLLVVLLLVIIVFFTNYALTRYISHNIMSPIDTLVSGVHEIRDGNLTYRIEYQNNDEFAAVCSDFNEMAARLLDMVNQRQKDELNQKELIACI